MAGEEYPPVKLGEAMWTESELSELYVDKGMSAREIAEECETSRYHVLKHLHHYALTRTRTEAMRELHGTHDSPATYYTDNVRGYEVWSTGDKTVYVHRLLAVAEFGLEAVKDKDVHHKNGVKWDNRPENIEAKDGGEHIAEHWHGRPLEDRIEEASKDELQDALEKAGYSDIASGMAD